MTGRAASTVRHGRIKYLRMAAAGQLRRIHPGGTPEGAVERRRRASFEKRRSVAGWLAAVAVIEEKIHSYAAWLGMACGGGAVFYLDLQCDLILLEVLEGTFVRGERGRRSSGREKHRACRAGRTEELAVPARSDLW